MTTKTATFLPPKLRGHKTLTWHFLSTFKKNEDCLYKKWRELAEHLFFLAFFFFIYIFSSSPKQLSGTQHAAHIVPRHELTTNEEKVNQVTKQIFFTPPSPFSPPEKINDLSYIKEKWDMGSKGLVLR